MNGELQSTDPEEYANGGQPAEADFLTRFCDQYHCKPRRFETRLFLQTVYPQSAGVARIMRWFRPGLFRSDFELIRQVKHARSFGEVKRLVNFHGTQNEPHGILRLVLKVRVSKQRMVDLAQALFAETD